MMEILRSIGASIKSAALKVMEFFGYPKPPKDPPGGGNPS
jgi:hypothetical protein